MPIRFHLDEHVAPAIAYGLRRHAVDVTTSQEASLLGREDNDQLTFAIAEQRVLVTHDEDFVRFHAQGVTHTGVCYCHLQKYSMGELLRMLLIVTQCLSEKDMENHLEYL
jgi:predicted nuclease of predicted toxin-antitoxin system